MIGLFDELIEELPPFKKFLHHINEKKKMPTVEKSKTRQVHMALLRKELFNPDIEDNISCSDMVKEISIIATEAFLDELHNQNKASYKYLSSSDQMM